VELERVVPPSGNLWLAGQQIWLGPALTGHTIRLWAGPDRVHVLMNGQRIQVGLPHAGNTAQVTIAADTYQITVEPGIIITAPRTASRDIKRHKASNYASP
jgi:hypothetical protein